MLNNHLKNVRKKNGLTQAEIASKSNISTRHYQSIEADECVPNVYTAILIARAVNTTVEDIFNQPIDCLLEQTVDTK